MSNIEKILNFIDSDNSQNEQPQETIHETIHENPQNEKTPEIPQNETFHEYSDKEYKKMLRDIKKIKTFPNILKVNGENKIFNEQQELTAFMNTLKEGRKEYMKNKRKNEAEEKIKKIKPIANKLKKYEKEDNDIDENGFIYKVNKIPKAVKLEDNDYREIPRTNKKDRKKIYNALSSDKETIKKLVQTENEEEFDEITSNAIKDQETKDIYEIHKENKILKDKTWKREQLLQFIEGLQNKNIPKPTKEITPIDPFPKNEYGINPKLFKSK